LAFSLRSNAKLEKPEPRGARVFEGRNVTMKNFINMLNDDSGASAAEYALILAIVG
jgi:hypothetical protein